MREVGYQKYQNLLSNYQELLELSTRHRNKSGEFYKRSVRLNVLNEVAEGCGGRKMGTAWADSRLPSPQTTYRIKVRYGHLSTLAPVQGLVH